MLNSHLSLSGLVDAVKRELEVKKYSLTTIERFNETCNKLTEYANQNGTTNYSAELGNSFLSKQYNIDIYGKISENQSMRLRFINKLNDYQQFGYLQVKRRCGKRSYPLNFEGAVNGFIEHRKSLGICSSTIYEYGSHFEDFCLFLTGRNIDCIEQIDADAINKYLETLTACAKGTKANYARHLRFFFKYAYENGFAEKDLTNLVPMIRYNKRPELPSTYTAEEIERLIACIDRGNPKGKRDYAIILMTARLGMRAGDICKLRFNNINWEKEQLEFIQGKTGNPIILPLLNDVGEAIIDYLKFGRPSVESQIVFLKHTAPIQGFGTTTLHYLVTRYMQEAKIQVPEGKRHGPHALRHSLASRLLEESVPLPVISEILGHIDSKTTQVYLDIDINQLRTCALEVPETHGGGF